MMGVVESSLASEGPRLVLGGHLLWLEWWSRQEMMKLLMVEVEALIQVATVDHHVFLLLIGEVGRYEQFVQVLQGFFT